MAKTYKGLFYCQSYHGIGHTVVSLRICQSLIKSFEIDFMLGSRQIPQMIHSPKFHLIQLEPLDFEKPHLTDMDKVELGKILYLRRQLIERMEASYDFVITEFFPFSRLELTGELEVLFKRVKEINPKCLIFCSLRDIFGFRKRSLKVDETILNLVHKHYDYIFMLSVPELFKIEDSFMFADRIKDKVIYIGYVGELEVNNNKKTRQKRIVASLGGGSFGFELLEAVIKIGHFFPDYEFILAIGPKTPSDIRAHLETIRKNFGSSNISIVPFISDFQEYLRESALSISLGGYNTTMDVLQTKTPAILYPSTFIEQTIRVDKLDALGMIKKLTLEDLDPLSLKKAIEEALTMPITYHIDFSGSEVMRQKIESILKPELV